MSDTKNAAAALLERLQYKGLHLTATAEGRLRLDALLPALVL